ncbi:MAG TPA: hypothetical protein VFF68_03300 [Anaerolineaceae bacterium]|nr:hypothetical protein [Anaerolineaceae bacterium]
MKKTNPAEEQGGGPSRDVTMQIRSRLNDAIVTLRNQIEEIDDPRGQALFETSAEVLEGLVRAFEHYEQRSEKAWRS